MEEIKAQILEWDSYLPQVKRQSIDVLVDNIIDLAVSKERERIVERIKEQAEPYDGSNWHNQLSVKTIINLINTK